MQYLRSRQKPVKSGPSTKSAPSLQLSGKIALNPSKYFDAWLKNGKDWGAVEVEDRQSETSTLTVRDARNWMYAWKMDEMFGAELAEVLRASLRDTEDHSQHPQCEDPRFDMYNVVTNLGSSERERICTNARSRTLRGELTQSNAPEAMMRALVDDAAVVDQSDSGEDPPQTPVKTPQEIADEEVEKLCHKEKLEVEKQKPENVVRRWLASLPHEIQKLKTSKAKVIASVCPESTKQEYTEAFSKHIDALTAWRSTLEDAYAVNTFAFLDLNAARAAVATSTASISAWKNIVEIFEPPKKIQKKGNFLRCGMLGTLSSDDCLRSIIIASKNNRVSCLVLVQSPLTSQSLMSGNCTFGRTNHVGDA